MITSIVTTDSIYNFTPNYFTSFASIEKAILQNNNQKSDTQGFLRKIQIGDNRIQLQISVKGTKTELENNLLPMLTYPTSVIVTSDRSILNKTINYFTAVIEDYSIEQEFDNGDEQEVTMVLTEVL